ncbi:MAG: M50 family metallopeptidase [Candidatus Caenarcaniphilales bacterium]|nr:M50 family metallopeptidase [Candidatus Caenarcaniphilales bacterium]
MLVGFLSILGAIGLLLVLIIVHEAGHFFAARYFGMQTPVIGLGLPFVGPTWVVGKFQDIEFRFHPFLLGAYVAIPEMDDESSNTEELNIELEKPKKSFPAWQRMIVSFAGPGANFLFALFLALITVIFLGIPESVDKENFYISQVSANANEDVKAKLRDNDQILGLDNEPVQDQFEFIKKLQSKPNSQVLVWLERQEGNSAFCLKERVKTNSSGRLNISLTKKISYVPVNGIPIISHIEWAWKYFASWLSLCINGLWYLLSAPFRQEIQGPKITEVHGVILATTMIAKFIEQSASSVLQWGALFSIELGIFNLLPILPLDGGHILFQAGELVFDNKKLYKIREYVAQAGLTLILLLACLIIFNDLRDLVFPSQL